ncbi:hypothetical protein [Nocardia brasiliensis]|nr:hypothetical protein [Nocardia brasiliensis]
MTGHTLHERRTMRHWTNAARCRENLSRTGDLDTTDEITTGSAGVA